MIVTLHALLLTAVLAGAPEAPAPVDVLAEARRIETLIDRGDLDAARRSLSAESFPEIVRVTLEGRLALAEGNASLAEKRFRRALALAPDHAPLKILRAHALLALRRYAAVLDALAGSDARDPVVALLRAAAHEGAGDPERAYATLHAAASAHEDHAGLRRELVLLCARQGLLAAARTWASSVAPAELGRDAVLYVLQEIRPHTGALDLARFLAAAFPDDAEIQAQLGWVASAQGRTLAAATAFERATRLGSDQAFAAAEHYRAAGQHRRALAMNALVRDPLRKAEQRFDILFESGAMARAIVVGDALDRSHGLSARRRYDLAYAHYVLRQHAEASKHARKLADTDEAARAAVLLRAMGREWGSSPRSP